MLLLWSVLVMPLSKWPLGSNKMFLKWISVLTKDIFKRRFQRWLQSTPISCSQDERMKYQHRPLHPFYPDVAPQKTTPTSKAPAATTHLIFILESHWKSFFGSRILLDFSVNLLQKLLLLWLSVYSNIGWLHNPNVSKSEVEAATEDQTNQSSSLSTAWTSCCRALEFFFPPGRIKVLFRGMRSSDNFRALVSTDYNHYRAWVGKKNLTKLATLELVLHTSGCLLELSLLPQPPNACCLQRTVDARSPTLLPGNQPPSLMNLDWTELSQICCRTYSRSSVWSLGELWRKQVLNGSAGLLIFCLWSLTVNYIGLCTHTRIPCLFSSLLV